MSNNPVRIFDSQGRPLAVTAVGDGTYKLQVDTELTATIDPTGLATSAKQDSLIAKFPDQSGGKVPVVMASETDIATMQDDIALMKASGSSIDGKFSDISKAEDAIHSSGDKGVMTLGVRKDIAASLAGTDGDYAPYELDDMGRVHVNMHMGEVLSALLDSIDVAKMSKGAVTTAHSAIAATATSSEIDCRGFNSLIIHWVSDQTDKTWTISVEGAMGSGLTFVPLLDKATGLAASEITTDISGWFVISNVPDYIKIVATEVDDGATVTCKVQPFNG